jgi:hypothetical protein
MKVWKVTFHEQEAREDSTAWSSENIPADSFDEAYEIAKKSLAKSELKLKISAIEYFCDVLIREDE